MKFVLIGEESLLIQCGSKLLENGHIVPAVVSKNNQIKEWASQKHISVFPFDRQLSDHLQPMQFDYLLSIANLKIIPEEVLKLPAVGAINFHDGPLPHYAGLYTTSWAIINGESTHGVTWHVMEAGIDTGNILASHSISLTSDETAFSLNAKCFEAGMTSFEAMLPSFAKGVMPPGTPQDSSKFAYYAKNKRPDAAATFNWNQSAAQLEAMSRGLAFGGYENPMMMPKLLTNSGLFLVPEPIKVGGRSTHPAGTITNLSGDSLTVATSTNDVTLTALKTVRGDSIQADDFSKATSLSIGTKLPAVDSTSAATINQLTKEIVRHEAFWVKQLSRVQDVEIPYARRQVTAERQVQISRQPISMGVPETIAHWLGYLLRLSGQQSITVANVLPQKESLIQPYFAQQIPINVSGQDSWQKTVDQAQTAVEKALSSKTYSKDLVYRFPTLNNQLQINGHLPVTVGVQILEEGNQPHSLPENLELMVAVYPSANELCWLYDEAVYDTTSIQRMISQFSRFIEDGREHPAKPLEAVQLQSNQELHEMLFNWNATQTDYDRSALIHNLFVTQAANFPEQTAVFFKNESISYAKLDQRSNQMAHHLQSLGVGPDIFVGVYMKRSIDLMVALFGILKAGGSYLPLDPDYPADRLAFMVEDTATPVIITESNLVSQLPAHRAQIVQIDQQRAMLDSYDVHQPKSDVQPHHLSYIIYTSGSTGKPKGVMVEHRNVVNFFVGMDERIPHKPGNVWLATTSLSFDISVLELFWTLARGLTIVLHDNDMKQTGATPTSRPSKPVSFSLFYFASDASEGGIQNKYQLLLEGAKFADANGFEAVWTPERHFHAFGGLYPNPAITGTAVAAVTENVKIRAGSLVSPLHHPIRITEEWSVLDNISNGRVGISFAAGWQPNDFVLAPDHFKNSKALMFEQIETVKKLWEGETVTFPGPNGDVDIQTLPRPVQKSLPIWMTAAGNPETFRMAGERGFHMLTHLLGQSVEDLTEKLAIYRQAWKDAGHPGEGHVTLMLHTFVGDDEAETKEIVRPHLKAYLRSAVYLIKQAAWSFPTFKQKATATGQTPLEVFESEDLTDEEMEALLDFAFERYYEGSGLLGTIDQCEAMVETIRGVGVDEVACQIDFGVPSALVLDKLDNLNALYQRVGGGKAADANGQPTDFSIPALIERHHVTHFQCTPSMMSMLLVDDRTGPALNNLQVCMLGGEALPDSLAEQVVSHLSEGKLVNMYGPTETTIWSSTADITSNEQVTIGRPIANTQLYVVNGQLQPMPAGVAGELLIGGDGVVRGYHNRPELTAERFIPNPFSDEPEARVYRTGDLARFMPDGRVEFLGRIDFQVKIRGYRIELGEIESLLSRHVAVREAIVTAREDTPGDKRLVAYVIPITMTSSSDPSGPATNESELKLYLQEFLPEFMVPSHFVILDRFPLTPNNKTDRKALPAPNEIRKQQVKVFEPPENQMEAQIAELWRDLLNLPQVGINENFFDLGGHSLLAVQLHRRIKEIIQSDLTITDIFRFPTIRSLTDYLGNQAAEVAQTKQKVSDRASARRQAMMNRRDRRRR